MLLKYFFGAGALLVMLASCSSGFPIVTEYRINVQQGNVLSQDMVSRLRPGLTRDQVRFILGTPMLSDIFHAERWDYAFRLQEGKTGQVALRHFSVFFDKDGLLSHLEGDIVPGQPEEINAPPTKAQVIDLGFIEEGAPELPPPDAERSLWRRFLDSVGF